MSESQASLFSDQFSDAGFLRSDSFPGLPTNSRTVDSTPLSELTNSPQYTRAPGSLERVGPRFREFWTLWKSGDEMENYRKDFTDWWMGTEFGSQEDVSESTHWDGRKKNSELWESFEQVAHEKTGEPKVMCKHCNTLLVHANYRRKGSSPMKGHLASEVCHYKRSKASDTPKTNDILRSLTTTIAITKPQSSAKRTFSQELLLEKLLTFITCAQVPFRIIERPGFMDLMDVIQVAQSEIDLPSARTARRFLDITVQKQQQTVLDRLPPRSRLSIALGCWASPFRQAFMAITVYFLNQDWEYREILEERGIAERVLSITTDNATNNNTMMMSVQDTIQSQGLSNASVFRIPCIAQVLQLSLHQLLGKMKVEPGNNQAETEWSDERTHSLHSRRSTREIVDTLNKVYYLCHPEAADRQLQRKRVSWEKVMLEALTAARTKLSEYYTATEVERYGGFYGMATILAPSKKLRFFTTKDWQGHDYAKQYRKCLEEGLKRYKQELSKENTPVTVGALTDSPGLNNVIETLLDPQTSLLPESDEDDDDEIARYLARTSGLNPAHPRAFWGEHEHEFPVLANVARDVFSIPASGAGAERLFNCARDICFYRRSRLRPETIRELMLHRCTSKFELEQGEIDLAKEYISTGGAAAIDQERDEPISNEDDEEEEEEEEDDEDELPATHVEIQAAPARQKRPRSSTSESLNDLELPEMPTEGKETQGRAGRKRRPPSLPDGFEIDNCSYC
ncbi:Pc17g00520 [Penicillium rubens Wisconsin 54-1255]|uniref:Pc17g00520 protein n=1 Tax=Penicillium rubens (strain ATCC 28089 / DSM 1075 / NRRL 1951 / Wisconsin 54-1255) TaxID=500485 RepID=B6HAY0_PENRW|nr:Pc17g00520 [Penicillium rubens Wisconsin 54-1255]